MNKKPIKPAYTIEGVQPVEGPVGPADYYDKRRAERNKLALMGADALAGEVMDLRDKVRSLEEQNSQLSWFAYPDRMGGQ